MFSKRTRLYTNFKLINFFQVIKSLLFKDISFISLMNGIRNNYWFESNKKKIPKNLKCDYLIVLNKYFIPKYNKLVKSNYRVFGHFRNNSVKIKKTKF